MAFRILQIQPVTGHKKACHFFVGWVFIAHTAMAPKGCVRDRHTSS